MSKVYSYNVYSNTKYNYEVVNKYSKNLGYLFEFFIINIDGGEEYYKYTDRIFKDYKYLLNVINYLFEKKYYIFLEEIESDKLTAAKQIYSEKINGILENIKSKKMISENNQNKDYLRNINNENLGLGYSANAGLLEVRATLFDVKNQKKELLIKQNSSTEKLDVYEQNQLEQLFFKEKIIETKIKKIEVEDSIKNMTGDNSVSKTRLERKKYIFQKNILEYKYELLKIINKTRDVRFETLNSGEVLLYILLVDILPKIFSENKIRDMHKKINHILRDESYKVSNENFIFNLKEILQEVFSTFLIRYEKIAKEKQNQIKKAIEISPDDIKDFDSKFNKDYRSAIGEISNKYINDYYEMKTDLKENFKKYNSISSTIKKSKKNKKFMPNYGNISGFAKQFAETIIEGKKENLLSLKQYLEESKTLEMTYNSCCISKTVLFFSMAVKTAFEDFKNVNDENSNNFNFYKKITKEYTKNNKNGFTDPNHIKWNDTVGKTDEQIGSLKEDGGNEFNKYLSLLYAGISSKKNPFSDVLKDEGYDLMQKIIIDKMNNFPNNTNVFRDILTKDINGTNLNMVDMTQALSDLLYELSEPLHFKFKKNVLGSFLDSIINAAVFAAKGGVVEIMTKVMLMKIGKDGPTLSELYNKLLLYEYVVNTSINSLEDDGAEELYEIMESTIEESPAYIGLRKKGYYALEKEKINNADGMDPSKINGLHPYVAKEKSPIFYSAFKFAEEIYISNINESSEEKNEYFPNNGIEGINNIYGQLDDVAIFILQYTIKSINGNPLSIKYPNLEYKKNNENENSKILFDSVKNNLKDLSFIKTNLFEEVFDLAEENFEEIEERENITKYVNFAKYNPIQLFNDYILLKNKIKNGFDFYSFLEDLDNSIRSGGGKLSYGNKGATTDVYKNHLDSEKNNYIHALKHNKEILVNIISNDMMTSWTGYTMRITPSIKKVLQCFNMEFGDIFNITSLIDILLKHFFGFIAEMMDSFRQENKINHTLIKYKLLDRNLYYRAQAVPILLEYLIQNAETVVKTCFNGEDKQNFNFIDSMNKLQQKLEKDIKDGKIDGITPEGYEEFDPTDYDQEFQKLSKGLSNVKADIKYDSDLESFVIEPNPGNKQEDIIIEENYEKIILNKENFKRVIENHISGEPSEYLDTLSTIVVEGIKKSKPSHFEEIKKYFVEETSYKEYKKETNLEKLVLTRKKEEQKITETDGVDGVEISGKEPENQSIKISELNTKKIFGIISPIEDKETDNEKPIYEGSNFKINIT